MKNLHLTWPTWSALLGGMLSGSAFVIQYHDLIAGLPFGQKVVGAVMPTALLIAALGHSIVNPVQPPRV